MNGFIYVVAGFIYVAAGLYSIGGAAFNWNFFMNCCPAPLFAMLLGRRGTRIFYVLLGTGFLVFGVLIELGIREVPG